MTTHPQQYTPRWWNPIYYVRLLWRLYVHPHKLTHSKDAFNTLFIIFVQSLLLIVPFLHNGLQLLHTRHPHPPSIIGMAVYCLFSVWFGIGILGGSTLQDVEDDESFGIPFIYIGIIAFGMALGVSFNWLGNYTPAFAIGLLIVWGAMLVLSISPGIESGSEYTLPAFITLCAGIMLGLRYLLENDTTSLFYASALLFAYFMSLSTVTRLALLAQPESEPLSSNPFGLVCLGFSFITVIVCYHL